MRPSSSSMQADVVILGDGVGGCAAALAAARNGLRVVMTEETDWIGGQLTQQTVPPDEHPLIESFGRTAAYRLHPVEWNIGESTGMLVSFCLSKKHPPRHVRNTQSSWKISNNSSGNKAAKFAGPG